MIGVWFFLTMSWVCLQLVIVVFPDNSYSLFLTLFVHSGYPQTGTLANSEDPHEM